MIAIRNQLTILCHFCGVFITTWLGDDLKVAVNPAKVAKNGSQGHTKVVPPKQRCAYIRTHVYEDF